MIVSHKHKFIFLKTRKTAGTSIQVALSGICDQNDDIITGSNIKKGIVDESHTAGWNMDRFFTNHPHPPILDVKNFVSEWNDYFKFAFVRNPYEIIVSRYHWDVKGKGNQETSISGFREWIKGYCMPGGTFWQDEQWRYISINDKIAVDFVGRYESLNKDYDQICNMLNIQTADLGFQKSGYRDKIHYSKYYDQQSIDLVQKYFIKDLSLFNYTFEFEKDFELVDRKILIDQSIANAKNINGPSIIKVPDFVKDKLGIYYLYFADHTGQHIKMAYSDHIEGPYTLLEGGTLQLNQTPCNGHIASPDVHIKEDKIIMYYHGDIDSGQFTFESYSKDGINFKSLDKVLTPFYHREFDYLGSTYALCKNKNENSQLYEKVNNNYKLLYELLPGSRHTAIHVEDNILYIIYSLVGESPERLYVCKIVDWEIESNYELAKPELDWEGKDQPLMPSRYGMALGFSNELRDPYVYSENGQLYLLYSYGGESGISLGKLKKI